MCTAEETDKLVRFDDRRAVAEEMARKDAETLSAAEILATPFSSSERSPVIERVRSLHVW